MEHPCKHCGACDKCDPCDHCRCCRKCGKTIREVETPWVPAPQPSIPLPPLRRHPWEIPMPLPGWPTITCGPNNVTTSTFTLRPDMQVRYTAKC